MRQMKRGAACLLTLFSLSTVQATHLAAVYKHEILILPDADSILPDSPISWDTLSLTLPTPLSFPVGLTHDSLNNRLFVAEARPKEKRKIMSLTLNDDLEVVEMVPAVKSRHASVIEGMSYSPKSEHLYWTDASVKYIYKAMVPKDLGGTVSGPEVLQELGYRNEPRGLAVDPCNEHLFWSEKGGGVVPSSVEMWHPDKNKRHAIQAEEKNNIYQGLSFDATTRNLLWAVTKGDDINSTCRIVKTSVDDMDQEEVTSLENCYPFSLTSDDKYVYWADWGRQGIMRASLTDPKDIIKLVHTPHTISGTREHFGVYGLAKLTKENPAGENSCKGKNGNAPNYEDMMPQNPAKKPQLQTKEKTEGTDEVKEVPNASSDNAESTNKQDSQVKEAEEHKKTPEVDEKGPELEVDAGSSEHSEEIDLEENTIIIKDRIVMNLEHMNMQPQGDAPSEESIEEVSFESVEAVTGVNDKTQTDLLASESLHTLPPTMRCHEGQLLLAVVVLAGVGALFLGSTIILAIMLYRRRTPLCKGVSTIEAPQAVIVNPPRQVKRFGPKKHVASGNKSGHSESATCSGLANDGVSINIEDCCQMTLCETPCYTTVKKQGKSYKDIRKNKCDDKKGLLDDSEDM